MSLIYRAKPKHKNDYHNLGRWVYGWYCKHSYDGWPLKPTIIPSDLAEEGEIRHCEIDPETIGRNTEHKDGNRNEIWEHDIVKIYHADDKTRSYSADEVSYTVIFDTEMGKFVFKPNDAEYGYYPWEWPDFSDVEDGQLEVIGNEFDNPEFL